jgi:RNA polymerase sigma factor (sigma-70 family)
VLAVLARRCGWLDYDEREAIFHDAYTVMLEKERDGAIEPAEMHSNQVRAYLTQTAINKALDEGKRAERKRTEPIGERALAEPDVAPAPDEAAASHLEGAVVREIVAELPARRQAIIKLRFFFERTPDEIQRMLAISSRVYRRELERGVRHICEQFELVRAGTFCDTRRSLIIAFVAGSADEKDAREAREHLANCPGCAHWAAELREATRDVAVALPLPALALEEASGSRLAEAASAVHDQATQLVAGAKQQATAIIARLDPGAAGYATVARPGTLAAVVTGCIAVGGGATYCAIEGVGTPVNALLGGVSAKEDRAEEPAPDPEPDPRRERRPTQPTPPPTTVEAEPVPDAGQQPPSPSPQPNAQPEPEPAPEPEPEPEPVVSEFGAEGGAEPVAPAPAPATVPSTDPSASSSSSSGSGSAGVPGEFDP